MIEKIVLKNFKQFKNQEIPFNPGRNVLIGENGVGKSTVLLAISTVLSGSYSTIEKYGIHSLFNKETITEFLHSDKKYEKLPIVEVELFLDQSIQNHEINGKHNSTQKELNGLKLKLSPDDEFSEQIRSSLSETKIFPFEYYKVEFRTFSKKSYNSYKKYSGFLRYAYLDATKVNSAYAMKDYVKRIYESKADASKRHRINNEYRHVTNEFSNKLYNEFQLEKKNEVSIKLDDSGNTSFQQNIIAEKAGISIQELGQGERMFINTEFMLTTSAAESSIILIEEPESHLSHVNMHKLIDKMIETESEKQTFIATHSNMITARLDLHNAIFLTEDNFIKLDDLNKDTTKFFQKAPNHNILDFILSSKAILVEGDAEYILLNEFYKVIQGKEPHSDGIAIISCGGKTFKRYIEIADLLNKKVAIITDNDKDYANNINKNYGNLQKNISVFADLEDENYTFEVCLYNKNKGFLELYLKNTNMSNGVQAFMLNNKAEAAFRILQLFMNDNEETDINKFTIPKYIEDAIKWLP